MKLEPTTDDDHLMVGLEKAKVVMPMSEAKRFMRRGPLKRSLSRGGGEEFLSSEFDDVFEVHYAAASTRTTRSRRTKGNGSFKGLKIISILTMMMQKIDKVEEEVVEERLGKLHQSCNSSA